MTMGRPRTGDRFTVRTTVHAVALSTTETEKMLKRIDSKHLTKSQYIRNLILKDLEQTNS